MKRLIVLLMTVVMSFVLIGCGGDNDNTITPPSAETLLSGKTFYITGNELEDPDGYYQEYFDANLLVESEYAGDGTLLEILDTYAVSYSGTTVTITFPEEGDFALQAVRTPKSVDLVAENGFTMRLWYTIEDAKANPQVDFMGTKKEFSFVFRHGIK